MKVLIISHNPITDYNNMGKTLLSLFSSFSATELCQMYIYPTIPNVVKCGSYYRVTDEDVLKSFFPFSQKGRVINANEISAKNQLYERKDIQKLYRNKTEHTELKLVARKMVWTCGKWNNKGFRCWMEEQKPDVIFAAPGLSSFFYDVILKISKQYHLPIVSYVCDDFYFSTKRRHNGLLQKCYYASLQDKIATLMRTSSRMIGICDSLCVAYTNAFQCSSKTVCSGTNIPIAKKVQKMDGKVLRYFGNLQLNRFESLRDIGQALVSINEKNNTDYILEIYTGDSCPDELRELQTVKILDFVASDKMYELMSKAIMLVHVESFDKNDVERVRHSVSTKITDSLASGVCVFAYGPQEVASIQHLIKNQSAVIVSDKTQLEKELSQSLFSREKRVEKAQNGLITATLYHSSEKQSERVRYILSEVLNENSAS